MARRQKEPLRALTEEERSVLHQIARSQTEPAGRVARAKALLAVADGAPFTDAAHAAGRRSGDGVAHLVARFNRQGLASLDRAPGGGAPRQYTAAAEERILREFQRPPDRERDGTATWSLTTLQRVLRAAPDGFPTISTFTILQTLHAAGYTWQNNRTWCPTGVALRKRKAGIVQVTDPAAPKKRDTSSKRIASEKQWACQFGTKTKRAPIRPFPSQVPRGNRKGNRRASPMNISAGVRRSC